MIYDKLLWVWPYGCGCDLGCGVVWLGVGATVPAKWAMHGAM